MWLVREYKKRGGTYVVANKPKAKGKSLVQKKKVALEGLRVV